MPVKINSLDKIARRLKIDNNGEAQAFMTETCYRYMDKYVPMDNGDLRTNVSLTTSMITYESPYASYQFYGQRSDGSHKIKHWTTAGTGPRWDKRMISADIDQVVDEVQNFIDRGGN